ncbi:MAG: hypothetical protein JXA28_11940 [Bacteroidetes bacterium]|nr:hypothetical protein [Bacteroidota bacterium]
MRTSLYPLIACCLLMTAIITACGGGEQKSELDKLTEAAEQMGKAAQEMGKSAEEMATGATGESEPQPAVSFKVLMNYLPGDFGDMERQDPEGESMTMGSWNYSQASVNYRGPDNAHAEVEIFDYAYIPMLYSSFRMMWKMNYNKESSRGYERTTDIGDYPAIEKWTAESQNAEVTVLVGDRYIVSVKTRNLPEDAARDLLGMIDLKGLAKEKAQSPA